ncbi:hypothetical protein JCM11641_004201 [Rhodosporidiobolus odoratus]
MLPVIKAYVRPRLHYKVIITLDDYRVEDQFPDESDEDHLGVVPCLFYSQTSWKLVRGLQDYPHLRLFVRELAYRYSDDDTGKICTMARASLATMPRLSPLLNALQVYSDTRFDCCHVISYQHYLRHFSRLSLDQLGKAILMVLRQQQSLQHLSLATLDEVCEIGDALDNLHLSSLRIESMTPSSAGRGKRFLAFEALTRSSFSTLTSLDVPFRPDILSSLSSLSSLEHLYLSVNIHFHDDVALLPALIANTPHLVKLELRACFLKSEELDTTCSSSNDGLAASLPPSLLRLVLPEQLLPCQLWQFLSGLAAPNLRTVDFVPHESMGGTFSDHTRLGGPFKPVKTAYLARGILVTCLSDPASRLKPVEVWSEEEEECLARKNSPGRRPSHFPKSRLVAGSLSSAVIVVAVLLLYNPHGQDAELTKGVYKRTASRRAPLLDPDSLALIATLLEEELEASKDAYAAEQLQLQLSLAESRPASPLLAAANLPSSSMAASSTRGQQQQDEPDHLLSLRRQLDAVNSSLSRAAIPQLARQDHEKMADRMRAQRLAQECEEQTRREATDALFAQALQKEDDEGRDIDSADRKDAGGVLGEQKVRELMTAPPIRPMPFASTSAAQPGLGPTQRSSSEEAQGSSKGKGKARAVDPPSSDIDMVFFSGPAHSAPKPVDPRLVDCAICFESCRPVTDPYSASLSGAHSGTSYGIYLGPKEDKHVLCLPCGVQYLVKKIEDAGTGRKVFPIKCVECEYELNDLDASRILGMTNMEAWASFLYPLYCTAPVATSLLRAALCSLHARSTSASCSIRNRHFTAQTLAAALESCGMKTRMNPLRDVRAAKSTFALPPEQRAEPEDIAVLALGDSKKWKRCIGLKTHNNRYGRCAKNPPCALWTDEDQLLAAENRPARQAPPQPAAPPAQAPAQHAPLPWEYPAQPPQYQQYNPRPVPQYQQQQQRVDDYRARMNSLDFVRNGHVPRHAFTQIFLEQNECGYCQRQFANSHALQQHLAAAPHDVYACCGRLYRAHAHLQQHIEANDAVYSYMTAVTLPPAPPGAPAGPPKFANLYHVRTVGTAKSCFICHRETTCCLATEGVTDYLYACRSHLLDPGFAKPASSVAATASPSSSNAPSQVPQAEIDKVKKEYEEKQARKTAASPSAADAKTAESAKSNPASTAFSLLRTGASTLTSFSTSAASTLFPPPPPTVPSATDRARSEAETATTFVLQRDYYAMRVSAKRREWEKKDADERGKGWSFPKVPRGALPSGP